MARPQPPSTEGLCSQTHATLWPQDPSVERRSVPAEQRLESGQTPEDVALPRLGTAPTCSGRSVSVMRPRACWGPPGRHALLPRASHSLLPPRTQQVLNKGTTAHSTVPGVSVDG